MHDVVGVQVADCRHGLAEELEGLGLTDVAVFVLVGEESAIFSQFHDHVDDVLFDEGVPEFDEVRVVHAGVEVDLPLEQEQLVLRDGGTYVDLGGGRSTTLMA